MAGRVVTGSPAGTLKHVMGRVEVPDPAAIVVTEVLLALGRRGHEPRITDANGPRLMRLAGLMLVEFGVADGDERGSENE